MLDGAGGLISQRTARSQNGWYPGHAIQFAPQRPDVSLGSLVNDYQNAFTTRPWLFVWPGLFVVGIVLCLQFIGDGLRDAFDPRQKRVPRRKDLETASGVAS